jgi:hypothetical protein
LILETSNPNTRISYNILAVGLYRQEKSHSGAGDNYSPRELCYSSSSRFQETEFARNRICKKQNLQETEWSLRELGLIVRIHRGRWKHRSCFSSSIKNSWK